MIWQRDAHPLVQDLRGHKLKPGERKNLSEEAQKEKLQRQMRENSEALGTDRRGYSGQDCCVSTGEGYEQLIEVLELCLFVNPPWYQARHH